MSHSGLRMSRMTHSRPFNPAAAEAGQLSRDLTGAHLQAKRHRSAHAGQRGALTSPGPTAPARVDKRGRPRANVLNESFRSSEVLNDSFKTFHPGRSGSRAAMPRPRRSAHPGQGGGVAAGVV